MDVCCSVSMVDMTLNCARNPLFLCRFADHLSRRFDCMVIYKITTL